MTQSYVPVSCCVRHDCCLPSLPLTIRHSWLPPLCKYIAKASFNSGIFFLISIAASPATHSNKALVHFSQQILLKVFVKNTGRLPPNLYENNDSGSETRPAGAWQHGLQANTAKPEWNEYFFGKEQLQVTLFKARAPYRQTALSSFC